MAAPSFLQDPVSGPTGRAVRGQWRAQSRRGALAAPASGVPGRLLLCFRAWDHGVCCRRSDDGFVVFGFVFGVLGGSGLFVVLGLVLGDFCLVGCFCFAFGFAGGVFTQVVVGILVEFSSCAIFFGNGA